MKSMGYLMQDNDEVDREQKRLKTTIAYGELPCVPLDEVPKYKQVKLPTVHFKIFYSFLSVSYLPIGNQALARRPYTKLRQFFLQQEEI